MQRHYYICKTRKIVWPNEAMDARLSTVLADIQLLQSCVQTSVPRGFARYLQTAHGTDLKTVARRPNLSHSTDRKIYQSEACKNARYNVGCQWTFKNAEGGGGHRLFRLFWTLDTTIIFFSSVSCNLLEAVPEAVIPAGSRACGGSGASSSGLAPAGEVRTDTQVQQHFQERGGT